MHKNMFVQKSALSYPLEGAQTALRPLRTLQNSNCSTVAATFMCRSIVPLCSPPICCCGEAMVFTNLIDSRCQFTEA